jgi:hypothetical protein
LQAAHKRKSSKRSFEGKKKRYYKDLWWLSLYKDITYDFIDK